VRGDLLPFQSRAGSGHLLVAHVGLNPHGRRRHDFRSVPQRQDDLEQGSMHTMVPQDLIKKSPYRHKIMQKNCGVHSRV